MEPDSVPIQGLDHLRVVDASAFPGVPNGNTCAPRMMVAEKSGDLSRDNTPLPAAMTPFFRLRGGSPCYPPGDPRNSSGASS
ncbi:MAG: GMC oxidoreductase [Steroidobacteraceae bacterium]|nr:hypothetical protein [Steroidobacteraceae bacterium]MBP7012499.1 hypothetical protein [Steroidobacteraceae bacterium]